MAIFKGKIRQRNSGGTYDYLLPETTIDMVNGLQDELDLKVGESELIEVDNRLTQQLEYIKELAVYIDEFPRLVTETDDTGRFERAFNSGNNIFLAYKGEYTVDTVKIWTNDLCVIGNYSTIYAKTKTTQIFNIGADVNDDFIQVKNIKIYDLSFVGIDDTMLGRLVSTGVNVKQHSSLLRDSGCKNIHIERCNFEKLTMGIIATGTTGLYIKNCNFTDNFYKYELVAGGYGILIQTCYDVYIDDNIFVGKENDRHAIYLSNVSGINIQNENINVYRNKIDWSNVVAKPDGYEACVVVRSVIGFKFKDNYLSGGFGGILISSSNGNSSDIHISGNSVSGTRFGISDRCDIGIVNSEFAISNVFIYDNNLNSSGSRVQGISLGSGQNINIYNNKISAQVFGILLQNVSAIKMHGNDLKGCSNSAIYYVETINDVELGINYFNIGGVKERIAIGATVTNIKHNFQRSLSFNNSLVITSNPHNVINSIVQDNFGVKINFNKLYKVKNGDIIVVPMFSNPYYIYNRLVNESENSATIGIANLSNGAPVDFTTITNANLTLYINS